MESKMLPDIQDECPDIKRVIDWVGICHISSQIRVPYSSEEIQSCDSDVSIAVKLCADQRGIHMSRLVESLISYEGVICFNDLYGLLKICKNYLYSDASKVEFRFRIYHNKLSPSKLKAAPVACECRVIGILEGESYLYKMVIKVPVMSVCPCSKAISRIGAHSQRAYIICEVELASDFFIKDLIKILEQCGSSEVFSLIKRNDEKVITESAYGNPLFVEDIVRLCAEKLNCVEEIRFFKIRVESIESIHAHNAFAEVTSSR